MGKKGDMQNDVTDVEMAEWSQNVVSKVVETVNAISAVPSQLDN